jgi:hypothetical protein
MEWEFILASTRGPGGPDRAEREGDSRSGEPKMLTGDKVKIVEESIRETVNATIGTFNWSEFGSLKLLRPDGSEIGTIGISEERTGADLRISSVSSDLLSDLPEIVREIEEEGGLSVEVLPEIDPPAESPGTAEDYPVSSIRSVLSSVVGGEIRFLPLGRISGRIEVLGPSGVVLGSAVVLLLETVRLSSFSGVLSSPIVREETEFKLYEEEGVRSRWF